MFIKSFVPHGILLLLALLALSLNSAYADNIKALPTECQTDCASQYGQILGVSRRGVEAYSNCQSRCVVYEPNHWKGTYTGIRWQCVEYARRWLLINKGAIYGDVDIAAEIWNRINYLTDVKTNKTLPLESHLNGSKQPPQVGDLLIYARAFNETGHVAVVIDVDYKDGAIEVGEQNYNNEPWPGDFSRKIDLVKKGDNYWLLDAYLLGWKHINN
jgi:glutathionylspermidine amidase/synthetase